jgi:hypothetical protein
MSCDNRSLESSFLYKWPNYGETPSCDLLWHQYNCYSRETI